MLRFPELTFIRSLLRNTVSKCYSPYTYYPKCFFQAPNTATVIVDGLRCMGVGDVGVPDNPLTSISTVASQTDFEIT